MEQQGQDIAKETIEALNASAQKALDKAKALGLLKTKE